MTTEITDIARLRKVIDRIDPNELTRVGIFPLASEADTDDELRQYIDQAREPAAPTFPQKWSAAIHSLPMDSAQPAPAPATGDERSAFQRRVLPWMIQCFGPAITADRFERNHRFFEEATECVQANGMTRSEAHQLVDYTFDRPVGELRQEVGGVMVTLAALCIASDVDMHEAGEVELARVWQKIDQIRAKQAAKPKHSPLPEDGGSERRRTLARAVAAHGGNWPDELTSGLMFYEGERITKAEFLAEVRA